MTLHKFYFDAWVMFRNNPHLRIGQCLFNHLCTVRPDLAEKLRGGTIDPYYCSSSTDSKYNLAIQFIECNWNYQHYDGSTLNPVKLFEHVQQLEMTQEKW